MSGEEGCDLLLNARSQSQSPALERADYFVPPAELPGHGQRSWRQGNKPREERRKGAAVLTSSHDLGTHTTHLTIDELIFLYSGQRPRATGRVASTVPCR